MYVYIYIYFFFFQAEDGIRDYDVTGVQTCALPIWVKEILSSHYPIYIDPIVDAKIRKKFDVFLPLEAMRARG